MNYECPLCSLGFEGSTCHSACPMSGGCAMVRCPRCFYEFVPDGKLAAFFRRIFTRRNRHATSTR
ncbi:MAG TPA: hypothetical protein VF701_03980 [Thermoanaerobaculia bacterium]